MEKPKYQAVADQVRRRIQVGVYPVGTKLPSIAQFMDEFDVPGLNTIRGAHAVLADEGLVRSEQGVGVWVVGKPSSQATDRAGILEDLRAGQAAVARAITYIEALT
jgi:DNA-binding GntR family transcriptional regulator